MSDSATLSRFIFGGVAGSLSAAVVQPADLLKSRQQVAETKVSTWKVARTVIQREGFTGLYSGLSAAVFRQMTYSTTRFGVYQSLLESAGGSANVTFGHRLLFGVIAGSVGALVGNPAEVCLVRMTLDGKLPAQERRNYRHIGDALVRITKEEGVLTLWRGVKPTVLRCAILNCAQLASYSQTKVSLLARGYFDGNPKSFALHCTAGLVSGFSCTVASLPADAVKTRMQQMKPLPDGSMPYANGIDCLRKTVAREGVLSLWKGATNYFLRLGPHTILSFIFLEFLMKTFQPDASTM